MFVSPSAPRHLHPAREDHASPSDRRGGHGPRAVARWHGRGARRLLRLPPWHSDGAAARPGGAEPVLAAGRRTCGPQQGERDPPPRPGGWKPRGQNARGWRRTPEELPPSRAAPRVRAVHVCSCAVSVWKIKLMSMLGGEGRERSRSSPCCVHGAPCVAQSSGWAGGTRGVCRCPDTPCAATKIQSPAEELPEPRGGSQMLLKPGRSVPSAAP